MKKPLAILVAGTLMAGVFVLPVAAQESQDPEEYPEYECNSDQITNYKITLPAPGATVGRTFALKGSITPSVDDIQYVNIEIDGQAYVDPRNRTHDPNDYTQPYFYPFTDAQGNFDLTIDLSGNNVLEQYVFEGGVYKTIRSPIAAGTHKLRVGFDGYFCSNGPAEQTFILQDAAPKTVAQTAPRYQQAPKPAPSASPSPSVAPVMATPATETAGSSLNPAVALALGALLGAAILALAEVSALEYKRKHGARKQLKK